MQRTIVIFGVVSVHYIVPCHALESYRGHTHIHTCSHAHTQTHCERSMVISFSCLFLHSLTQTPSTTVIASPLGGDYQLPPFNATHPTPQYTAHFYPKLIILHQLLLVASNASHQQLLTCFNITSTIVYYSS